MDSSNNISPLAFPDGFVPSLPLMLQDRKLHWWEFVRLLPLPLQPRSHPATDPDPAAFSPINPAADPVAHRAGLRLHRRRA